ncbi:family 20 glycosylhydrolase [Caulobacter hibisci]|uniref:beta-N-acetylhexosaminidase n=1 Tax=Caulobacter hibisci TaxID=2035993 RepID=A0ABS0T6F5_9CAUL|nr:family 20 glycosylhydrolase [Caulobacter hibisci]MBI1687076.1 family 20 glycosylhydrolase [Caulobacter hibisci]
MIKVLLLATAAMAFAVPVLAAEPLSLTPAPAKAERADGVFRLTAATRIHVAKGDVEARGVALQLADLLHRARGLRPMVVEGEPAAGEAAISLVRGGPDGEGYALDVAPGGVKITALKRAGLFYGAVSLWQLAVQDDSKGPVDVPAAKVEDAPRFAWRGFMLDSARHYQSVETIRTIIDGMAAHKLNTLHWHLVDDQAWRIEIKKYPKLTQVSGWRQPAGAAGRDPKTGKPVRYGGIYTQDQVRDLVAYAAARNITIVPEIEMPGHALAPLVAYPKLGLTPNPPALARHDWGIFPYLYNVEDGTFDFLNDVLDEVMDLFPSEYIHVGGDEAVKDQWKASPVIQAKIKELGVKDEHGLQSWFIQRVEKHINGRGRRLIGWDEILEGGLAPNATVMSWRGIDGAIAAASQGHDTVLSPEPTLYFDRRQSASLDEPPGRIIISSLKDVYQFDAAPDALTADQRKHILGVQANLWTEHVRTDERAQLMAFPRLVALAETAWTKEERRDWDGFTTRLPAEMARLKALGVAADTAPFEPQATLRPGQGGAIAASLSSGLAIGQLRYTTDGAEPTAASPAYGEALSLKAGTVLKARSFLGEQPLGRTRVWTATELAANTRESRQLELCGAAIPLMFEDDAPKNGRDGDRAVFAIDVMNPCWIWKGADLSKPLTLTARVGQAPWNFQIGAAKDQIVVRKPATPDGELEVRLGCKGERIAVIPLGKAGRGPGLGTVSGVLPVREGVHDLCLTFTAKSLDPMPALDRVSLTAGQ